MNLVQCSSDCLYQKEGACAIGATAMQVRHAATEGSENCVYFVKNKQGKKTHGIGEQKM
jgi:hypothetical protein